MSKLIIVSNRLPVKIIKRKENVYLKPSDGGLATGLSSVNNVDRKIWIGWPGMHPETEEEKIKTDEFFKDGSYVPVYLTKKQIADYYEGFSNETIWPLFHYFNAYANYDEKNWKTYYEVNRLFCERVLEVAGPGDTIWVHDYHLMLLPRMLKTMNPDLNIGFFLHIPFPSYEVFRALPWRKQIVEGLLGADLIGFHIPEYLHHFVQSVQKLTKLRFNKGVIQKGERSIRVKAFPMGIDFNKYNNAGRTPIVRALSEELRENMGKCKIILSVDRLDYSKGIIQRLKVYENLLAERDDLRTEVTLLMLVVPSRESVEQYHKLKMEIDEIVGKINGKFGTPGWIPVHYIYRSVPFERLVSFYNIADVALVTPVRDGMNLVAKEYVASRWNKKGVLVLSEMAGAFMELDQAIPINPNDLTQFTRAIVDALEMPAEEQNKRLIHMQEKLRRNDINAWAQNFLNTLERAGKAIRSVREIAFEPGSVVPNGRPAYNMQENSTLLLKS